MSDEERGRARRRQGVKSPKAAVQGKIAADHRADAGVVLTHGPADAVLAAGARPAAAGYFMPIDGEWLRDSTRNGERQDHCQGRINDPLRQSAGGLRFAPDFWRLQFPPPLIF